MGIAQTFFKNMEMISLNVASSKINKELLLDIMIAILDGTYDIQEDLKLKIYNAISQTY